MMKNVLLAGVAAITVFAGLTVAPPLALTPATAQQIVIDPPKGAPVSFADLIEKVSPAVVSIEARGKVGGDEEGPEIPPGLENVPGFEDFLRRFREEQRRQPSPQSVALGSGFFISADGIVVTNEHVIDGADEITVRDTSGNEY
ncbi:MAG: S1C family serine protease, partial [Hyphomonadaceae bacterium]|nr:S1C family serine protease [Hyphomonadaceae bacterium]